MQKMAAKPPAKPPGNFLKQLNECISGGNNTTTKIFNKLSAHLKKNDTSDNNSISGSSCSGSTTSLASNSNINGNINEETATLLQQAATAATTSTNSTPSTAAKRSAPNCNCTNISIMHLFHEMKQEFPTVPDTIVTQCVNENCHQRENCIQQLRHELALHAIPMQTYPAKVLHPPSISKATTEHQQRRAPSVSAADPPTPLRPLRPAPVKPSLQVQEQQKQNCDSVSNNYKNSGLNSAKSPGLMRKDVISPNNRETTSDMPVTSFNSSCSNNIATNSNNINNNCVSETRSNENRENVNPNEIRNVAPQTPPPLLPRTRPTTLNLQQQQRQNQQHQQRQQINQQLQKHFQQRQQLLHQQQQQQTKPLRKAPLPPLPPKPAHYVSAGAHSPQFHHQNSYNNNNSSNNSNGNHNLVNSQRSSFSNDSSLTSPTSSVGESEISVNVSLSSPIVSTPPPLANQLVNAALRSPIRHRSVITLHPEPPYTRDFINASASSPTTPSVASSTGGSAGIPKSFTSVNLTLRQPNTNSAVPASTIDISAGPGLSGNGSGLTYSSTSYDARLGYQKNFHITVTDEGGVFSASRIRPRSCFEPEAEHQFDGPNSPTAGNQVNPLRTASSEQCVAAQQSQQQQLERLQQEQILTAVSNAGEMCLQKENNAIIEILDRQKFRRDKLATALRDNKKRLNQVEQEINVLTESIRPGENERLDEEIRKLRCDCEAMLNEIDISRRSGPSLENLNNRQLPSPATAIQQQPQPQPFPRQRSLRTTPTTTNTPTQRQPQLDFIQHHNTPATPRTPALSTVSSPHQQQQQQAPPTYQEYCQQYQQHNLQQQQQQQPFLQSTDEEESSDVDADDDESYEEEPLEMWACNMCTFQNHPQLNICECCENVRILPEPILSREDIHITLSPGGNRIIHSWILS